MRTMKMFNALSLWLKCLLLELFSLSFSLFFDEFPKSFFSKNFKLFHLVFANRTKKFMTRFFSFHDAIQRIELTIQRRLNCNFLTNYRSPLLSPYRTASWKLIGKIFSRARGENWEIFEGKLRENREFFEISGEFSRCKPPKNLNSLLPAD